MDKKVIFAGALVVMLAVVTGFGLSNCCTEGSSCCKDKTTASASAANPKEYCPITPDCPASKCRVVAANEATEGKPCCKDTKMVCTTKQ